ncbi:MAG: enoyl-CoA hydratase-related protein [Desulfobacteraceae bacterium]|jgi:enoyl-CoA hydratase
MAYEHILVAVENAIATITFNRPKALNALNSALLAELSQAVDELAAGDEIAVLVLTGAGDKAFVAGADINELAGLTPLQAKYFGEKGQRVIDKISALDIPVIAAVNGYALGGGTEMALGCDFIYASESASFGLPETNLGLIPGFGGTQRLARLIGPNRAKELIFTGKIISAGEAFSMGIVNRVLEADALMPAVMEMGAVLAAKGRVSLREAKQAVDNGLNTDLATGLKIERHAFALCMASEDANEGTRAFLEKRKAEFKGTLR